MREPARATQVLRARRVHANASAATRLHIYAAMKRICLVVADATRARIFTYQQLLEPDGPHEELREQRDLVNPARHKRAGELFSDNTGANHSGPRGYAFDDHRQAHLDQLDVRFAKEIAGEVERTMHSDGYRELIVVASSRMLGDLRVAFEMLSRVATIKTVERELTKLGPAAIRDHLAALGLLPARPHLAASSL